MHEKLDDNRQCRREQESNEGALYPRQHCHRPGDHTAQDKSQENLMRLRIWHKQENASASPHKTSTTGTDDEPGTPTKMLVYRRSRPMVHPEQKDTARSHRNHHAKPR